MVHLIRPSIHQVNKRIVQTAEKREVHHVNNEPRAYGPRSETPTRTRRHLIADLQSRILRSTVPVVQANDILEATARHDARRLRHHRNRILAKQTLQRGRNTVYENVVVVVGAVVVASPVGT